ncbi:DUF2213 domain-containing protein [[Haemophilus] felis]|nr:DUF2213 domain-containing protein [[Haemophilus] felis]
MTMRYDRLEFKAEKDKNGFIRDTPVLTRTGVFVYRQPDGTLRREYRPPDEVFKADSLNAFKGIPITDEHHGKITGNNAQSLVIGSVLSAGRQDGKNLLADIVIHNTDPVTKGKKELSVGYEVELEMKSGVTEDGEPYDAIQRNIKPNHLAIVSKGRAGNARLNMDAADAVQFLEKHNVEKPENLANVRLDSGITYQAAPEVINELNKFKQDAANAQAEKDKETARADAAEAKVKDLEAKQEQLKQDSFEQAKKRLALEAVAKSHQVEVKADSSDRQLQEAVIKAVRGDSVDLKDRSDAYIEAAFDMAVADSQSRADSEAQQRSVLTQPQMNQDGKSELTGRAKMMASRNQ